MSVARPIEEVLENPASTAEILRAVDSFDKREWSVKPRVHVLRNFTIENALPALRFAGFRRDVSIEVSVSGFDAYRQDALSQGGDLARADFVVVWLWLDALPIARSSSGALDGDAIEREVLGLVDDVRARTAVPIFIHTFLPPLGAGASWEGHDALDAVNRALRDRARSDRGVVLVDVARMAADLGRGAAIDSRFMLMHRAPLGPALARVWGDAVAQSIAARLGHVRKVLVVDADETLWGGIVGEDGPTGIRLSKEAYPGSAYHAFQDQLLALRRRGVLLALASKNEPESVFEVLDHHPCSLLRREHFAAMRIGWGPKSESIRSMAKELGLGLDAFVFVDDSPVECAEVRGALPMVEVLQMPREAHRAPSLLADVTLFDAPNATPEDSLRAEHYALERARTEERAQFADLDSFLASLDLEATVGPPSDAEVDRVAQLTQRSNQWNLTTERYDRSAIAAMRSSERFVLVALRARDRHGDYGLTGVGIASFDDEGSAHVDALLMSCRTLGRRLEEVLLAELVIAIRKRSESAKVSANYRPSAKNAQVARFFDTRGFEPVGGSSTDLEPRAYVLTDALALTVPSFIRIRRVP